MTNVKIYRAGFVDFSVGALVVVGMNATAQTWLLPLMWGLFFSLCVGDCWFGPIYNEAAQRVKREEEAAAASSAADEEQTLPRSEV